MPSLQTKIAKRAVSTLSDKIEGEISINKIHIVFFNRFILEDLLITSTSKDTLLTVDKLSVTLSTWELMQLRFSINRVLLDGGAFHLSKVDPDRTNLEKIFKIEKKTEAEKKDTNLELLAKEVRLKNFRFSYKQNFSKREKRSREPLGEEFINFTDFDFKNLNTRINKVSFKDGKIFGRIQSLSFVDKSGFTIEEFRSDMTLGLTGSSFENVRIKEGFSLIIADHIKFDYNSLKDLSEFTETVQMDGMFRNSLLCFKTIGKMSPGLKDNELSLYFTGNITGTVNNLIASSLVAKTLSGNTMLNVGANIKHVTDRDFATLSLDILDCHTNKSDVADIIYQFSGQNATDVLESISDGVIYNFRGNIEGLLSNFVIYGNMHTNIGDIDMDIIFDNDKQNAVTSIGGIVNCNQFHLGKLLSNNILGELTFKSKFNSAFGNSIPGGFSVKADSITISRLGFNNYNYSNIFAIGEYEGSVFDGRVICHDPNLDLIFQGVISFPGTLDQSRYDFYANIPYADLTALNIDKRGFRSSINTSVMANFTSYKNNDLVGDIELRSLSVKKDENLYDIGDIKISSTSIESLYNMEFISGFARASYNASASPASFINHLASIVHNSGLRELLIKYPEPKGKPDDHFSVTLETFDMRNINDFILPGLYIADSTTAKATIVNDTSMNITLSSKRIAYNNSYAKDVDFYLTNHEDTIDGVLKSSRIETAGLFIDNNVINITARDSLVHIQYAFTNQDSDTTRMNLSSDISFDRDNKNRLLTIFDVKESQLFFHGDKWLFHPATLTISDSLFVVDSFRAENKDKFIGLNGRISSDNQDILSLTLQNLDISLFNLLISSGDYKLGGLLSGSVSLSNPYDQIGLLMDIEGKSINILNNEMGDLHILSKWDQNNKRFNILVNNVFNDVTPLNIIGYYKPDDRYVDLRASLSSFGLVYMEPLVKSLVSNTSGTINGNVSLSGEIDKLNLESKDLTLENCGFLLNFTNVQYTLNGGIDLNENGASFKGLRIRDINNNEGDVTGGISFRHFKNFNFNTRISFMDDMQVLNTTESHNSSFYGSGFGNGNLTISGPMNRLLLDISVAPGRNTALHIPLTNYAEASQNNLLTFIENYQPTYNEEDNYKAVINRNLAGKANNELEVRLNAVVDNQSDIFIEINKQLGDVISAKGNGNITLDINPSRNLFDIKGNYTIEQGSYRFVIFGFGTRDFTIQEGGSINFFGDIMSSSLDLTATYRTKALISPLVSGSSSETDYSTRRNVDCSIGMSGPLSNPQLAFNIEVPDLNPSARAQVESALSTEDKILRQFMALLVSGSFIPDDQSGGIVNNSAILYSNASEIVTGQLNNIFKQLGVPLDLGFNYQPDNTGERDMFDVAISTQLFNNRVIINGSFGYTQYSSSGISHSNEIAGDVDMEIKLNRKGNMRLNLFTHSADKYSNFLDNTQRNGVGLVYQNEFSNLKELWRNIFWSRKRKERYETQKREELEAKIRILE